MSGISVNSYVNKARESESGVIRMDSKTQSKLVNRSTIDRQVTLLGKSDIGTRTQREQIALEGFKQTLVSQYGQEIAQKALDQAGIGDAPRLTGRMVLNTVNRLKEVSKQTGESNRALFKTYSTNHGFMVGDKSPKGELLRNEYESRFIRIFTAKMEGGQHALTDEEAQQCVFEALAEVTKLERTQGVDLKNVKEARESLEKAVANLLFVIGTQKSTSEEVLERMNTVEKCLTRLQEAEDPKGERPVDSETRQDVLKVAVRNAMVLVQARNPQILIKAQARILLDDNTSSLRGLYAGAREMSTDGVGAQKERGLQIMQLSELLVGELGGRLLPRNGTIREDLKVLQDDTTIKSTKLETAKEVIKKDFLELTPGRVFLKEIKDNPDFSGVRESSFNPGMEIAGWNSPGVLSSLEQSLRHFVGTSGEDMTYGECIDKFREGIESDGSIHSGLRGKLLAGLEALREEQNLYTQLSTHEQFAGVPREEMWKLFAPGTFLDRDPPITKWDLEQNSEGSLAGLYRSFGSMLSGQVDGNGLTPDSIEELHHLSTTGTFVQESLEFGFRMIGGEPLDQETIDDFRHEARMPQNFREDETNLNLRLEGQITEVGRQELEQYVKGNGNWFDQGRTGQTDTGQGYNLQLRTVGDGVSKARTESILENYRHRIDQAGDEGQKRRVIADTIQQLYRSHLFKDGNTRTMIFSTMNRMLLDNGMSPAILREPKAAAGFSLDEFTNEIRLGQERFQKLKTQQE